MATKQRKTPALQCSICKAEVTPETYAIHVQQQHAPQTFPSQPFGGFSGGFGAQPQAIAGPILGKDLAGGKYLKGEDVPAGVMEVKFKLLSFVRDPQGRSKLAAMITETYGKTQFGFNVTNIRALMALGFEDLQLAVGKTLVCMLGMQPNPQKGGAPTKALFISRVEP